MRSLISPCVRVVASSFCTRNSGMSTARVRTPRRVVVVPRAGARPPSRAFFARAFARDAAFVAGDARAIMSSARRRAFDRASDRSRARVRECRGAVARRALSAKTPSRRRHRRAPSSNPRSGSGDSDDSDGWFRARRWMMVDRARDAREDRARTTTTDATTTRETTTTDGKSARSTT